MPSKIKLNLIVAACSNGGIGINGNLPWRIRGDMAFFKKITTETKDVNKMNAVIMGRKTWDSIPAKFRPLPKRINIVLSRAMRDAPEGCHLARSLDDALDMLQKAPLAEKLESIHIIGGSSVYKMALESEFCHRIYLTRVHKDFECDTFLPGFDENMFKLVSDPNVSSEKQTENNIEYNFEVYERIS